MDVFTVIVMNDRSVAAVGRRDLAPGGADDVAAGNRHADVVDAIVGIELRARMELVGVPSRIFEDADFREPLAEEVVVVDIAGARKRPWNLRAPLDVDFHHSIR
jgi:hypothetical protein